MKYLFALLFLCGCQAPCSDNGGNKSQQTIEYGPSGTATSTPIPCCDDCAGDCGLDNKDLYYCDHCWRDGPSS